MIKLTNASEEYVGKVLYLNPSHIVSMYSEDSKTLIYGGLTGSTVIWTVAESMEEVNDLINGVKKPFAPYGLFNGKAIETEEEFEAIRSSSNL